MKNTKSQKLNTQTLTEQFSISKVHSAQAKKKYFYSLPPILTKNKFIWSTLIFMVITFYLYQGISWFCFKQAYTFSTGQLLPLNITFMVILLIDIFITIGKIPIIETAQHQPQLSQTQKTIYYLFNNQNLFFKLLALITLFLSFLLEYRYAMYFHLFTCVYIIEVLTYSGLVRIRVQAYRWMRILFNMFQIVYVLILLGHWLGCIFYVMDQYFINNQSFGDPLLYPSHYWQYSSADFTPIAALPAVQKYIFGTYFSLCLLTTMPYGDLNANNYIQDIYVTILMVGCTISIAFILQKFMTMISTNSFALLDLIKKFKKVEKLMKDAKVPTLIEERVRNYIFYVQYQQKFHRSQEVYQNLPEHIKFKLLSESYLTVINPLFQRLSLNNPLILANLIEEVIYQQQMLIYDPHFENQEHREQDEIEEQQLHITEHEINKTNFLYLWQGKFEAFLQHDRYSQKININIGQIKCFNFGVFITGLRGNVTIKARYLTKAVVIHQSKFFDVLEKQQPNILKNIIRLKENLLCNQIDRGIVDDACIVCQDNDHNFQECPQCHYVINQNIQKAVKITNLIRTKICLSDRFSENKKKRSLIKSKKIRGLKHQSSRDQGFEGIIKKQEKKQHDIIFSLIKGLVQISTNNEYNHLVSNGGKRIQIDDCQFDDEGIDFTCQI